MEDNTPTTEDEVYTFQVSKKTIRKVMLWSGVAASAGVILSTAISNVRNNAMLEGYEIAHKEGGEILVEIEDTTEETPENNE